LYRLSCQSWLCYHQQLGQELLAGSFQPTSLITKEPGKETLALLFQVNYRYFGSIEASTKAPIIPGIQPIMVNKVTTITAPQPLSNTARGGSKMAKISLPQPIAFTPLSVSDGGERKFISLNKHYAKRNRKLQ
jgi:hypothetical protein